MITIKEAILKTLGDLKNPTSSTDIYNHIIKNDYYSWGDGKTPKATISSIVGYFSKKNDERISRITNDKNKYLYYLTKYTDEVEIIDSKETKTTIKKQKYQERDLHKLLASYLLEVKNVDSKTIYHENSKKNKDRSQKWVHPDMVGVNFKLLKTLVAKDLISTINKNNFDLYSYELKREINNDYELKEAYFQALSNSSWANYGYLVAFDVSSNLLAEIKRLNDAFGIGVINLKANPYESKVLHTAKYKELDITTIDKLANINDDYRDFIKLVQKVNNDNDTKKLLTDFCDDTFESDADIEKYCQEKHIPQENFEDE
jgi:hypothetical protein